MPPAVPALRLPSRRAAAVFAVKVALLRLRRGLRDLGRGPARLAPGPVAADAPITAESRTPLWSDPTPGERRHQMGKVQNLRRAARAFDGLVIPAGATFSFWRQLGRASRRRGFVDGRMLQGGCMVPATGGGLCQMSNALHDVALQAGCTIVERHAHSHQVPGSAAAPGRDATVAWNYVDLRFRPASTVQLRVLLTRDELVVRLQGASGPAWPGAAAMMPAAGPAARSCATCARTACFRHDATPAITGRRAFLLDELWPEFIEHLEPLIAARDWIGSPFPGRVPQVLRSGRPDLAGARWAGSHRSLGMRRAASGAPVRLAAVTGAAGIARRLADQLPPDATELVVAQSFLPHLWRDGHLGGRRFSVLMTRPPMEVIQARLDSAFAAHPDRATLADFRADPALVRWEAEALAAADHLVTPHADLASLFPGRSLRLDWRRPACTAAAPGGGRPRRIAFPGPTLARKGAFEVREVARLLDLEVVLPGSPSGAGLERPGFWAGVKVVRPGAPGGPGPDWLAGVGAVVQPALVEERPRRLLAALAAGIPVLATRACGLDDPGVTVIEPLDAQSLAAGLERILGA